MVGIGKKAPSFTLDSTKGEVHLQDYAGKWLVLFFYPLDFTPV
jgi:peroxiredoxin 2/4